MPQASPSQVKDSDRLRSLTDAVIAVGAGLELGDVLQRLVTTAATFSGARYGALGITGADGRISQFITHGITAELRERLGGVPGPHGVPGLLLQPGAHAVRLSSINEHPGSVGFPEHHPPMQTFLGVPVRVSGTIFGNLYVADKQDAAGTRALFTAADEEALLALGAAAGVAIENARLYAALQQRQRWSDALGEANHSIIAHSELDARARLAPVPAIARVAAGCELAALAVRQAGGRWQVRYADSADDGTADASDDGTADATADHVVGLLLPDVEALRPAPDVVRELTGDDLAWLPGTWSHGLLVPVDGGRDSCDEALVLAHRHDASPALGRADHDIELAFGQRLGLGLQVAQARADSAALTLLRDRDRIARDLHDLVIQRLFAIGLSLQAAGVAARVPEVASRLNRAVDDIDETIKDVRRTIFELHGAVPHSDLQQRVRDVVAEAVDGLALSTEVHVGSGVDTVPADLAPDLLAALREALANVVRHARAGAVQVYVTAGHELELEVVDDGIGPPADVPPGEGLANLTERASAHGGTCEFTPGPDGGTVLRWAVPLTR